MKLSVVIAAYNEADNIEALTSRLITTLDQMADVTWELIYVIEGTDQTRALAERFAASRSEIRILYNPEPTGLANAFRKGFAAVSSDADFVVTMDADLNHQPEEIPRLVSAAVKQGAGIVVGSRKVAGSASAGTPLWKRTLSDAANHYMRWILGMPVADMTSGYRVYRYQTLRDIHFGSRGFAFLPEMLMQANAAKHKIVEEPIQFIFRVAGESKMRLLPTTLSYLQLLVSRSTFLPGLAAAIIFAAALSIWLSIEFPIHKYQGDADAVVSALCGIKVLTGSHPVFFPTGYRLGAHSCYVTAATFSLLGVSRQSLAITALLLSFSFIFFVYLYLREAFGPWAALAGLALASLPPLQVLLNTYVPWAYTEILMYSSCALWLATRLERRRPGLGWYFAFGLSCGLAVWCSPQSMMITAPLFLWLCLRKSLNSTRRIGSVLLGVIVGTSPIWIFLVRNGTRQIAADGLTHTAGSISQMLANTSYLVTTQLPWLFAETRLHGLRWSSGIGILLLIYLAAALYPIYLAFRPNSELRRQRELSAQALLLMLITLCCTGIYLTSAAGSVRGWTVRYILPLYLVIPPLASLLWRTVNRAAIVLVIAGVVFAVSMNLKNYPFMHSPMRDWLQTSTHEDEQFIEWLEQNGIQAVLGNYWDVYPLNFDSGGQILGIPVQNQFDYVSEASKLGRRTLRWAIIDHEQRRLLAWEQRLNSPGKIIPVEGGRFVFLPAVNPPGGDADEFLHLARVSDPPQ